MKDNANIRTIPEPNKEVKVCRECDVVVVGGGPGGIGAALAAARNGADTVLIERYGYLGGMATGGLVTIIPYLSDFNGKQWIAGITQEWIDRLDACGATVYPPKEIWGFTDKSLCEYWNDRIFFYVRQQRVLYSACIDAEVSKCLLNDMVTEAGIKTYLHSWGTMPIMDGNQVKGVVFESKSGRQAVMAKVVIDSTGDGDLLPYSGAGFDTDIDTKLRISNMALAYWIDGVNLMKADYFRHEHPQQFAALMEELVKKGGKGGYLRSNLRNQEHVVWFHNHYPNSSQTDVEELTRIEFEGRQKMQITHDFFKKNIPGFENSFIVISAPQVGTRGARRIHGEYKLTQKDLTTTKIFDDTIAIFPDTNMGLPSEGHPLMYMPYRCLVSKDVENLLVGCRAFSSDDVVNNQFNLIPHCVALGEAAGTAAALAVKQGVSVKKVDIETLQKRLAAQNVPLPGRLEAAGKRS